MRHVRYLITACLFLSIAAPAAFSATSVETEVIISADAVTITAIGEYHAVTLGPSGSTSEIGKPMLPERTIWVAIPADHIARAR